MRVCVTRAAEDLLAPDEDAVCDAGWGPCCCCGCDGIPLRPPPCPVPSLMACVPPSPPLLLLLYPPILANSSATVVTRRMQCRSSLQEAATS